MTKSKHAAVGRRPQRRFVAGHLRRRIGKAADGWIDRLQRRDVQHVREHAAPLTGKIRSRSTRAPAKPTPWRRSWGGLRRASGLAASALRVSSRKRRTSLLAQSTTSRCSAPAAIRASLPAGTDPVILASLTLKTAAFPSALK